MCVGHEQVRETSYLHPARRAGARNGGAERAPVRAYDDGASQHEQIRRFDEPSAIVLSLLGVVGLAVRRRRRSRG
jgi:MYXO-CTERM domain-containing protein